MCAVCVCVWVLVSWRCVCGGAICARACVSCEMVLCAFCFKYVPTLARVCVLVCVLSVCVLSMCVCLVCA